MDFQVSVLTYAYMDLVIRSFRHLLNTCCVSVILDIGDSKIWDMTVRYLYLLGLKLADFYLMSPFLLDVSLHRCYHIQLKVYHFLPLIIQVSYSARATS